MASVMLRQERRSFDDLLQRLAASLTSHGEEELLRSSHWDLGEDARLREDFRFRQTPWGRWMRSEDLLANDTIHRSLHAHGLDATDLTVALESIEQRLGQRCILCPADPRIQVAGTRVRLSASELSDRPALEHDIGPLQQYSSHLPLQSLKAAAASLPLGEWGEHAQQDIVEPLGWLAVTLSGGRRLSPRMFVAQVTGHSMDNGTSGIVDGAYVIFEFDESDPFPNAVMALVRGPSVDREFGSFVVKRFQPERDEQDETVRVTLLSLNADKDRYPDIGLHPGDEFELVARVVEPLSVSQFARVPKPRRRKGRRDIASRDGLLRVQAELARKATAFFDEELPVGPPGDAEQPQQAAWRCQFVCLEAEAGALHLEIGPLLGLWRFVKVLGGQGAAGATLRTLASNARLRPVLLPVNPGDGPWSWAAEGFEDDEDVDLSALDHVGLARAVCTLFRVGSDGVGRPVSGITVSPGQHYRMVVPPSVPDDDLDGVNSVPISGGWRLVDLDLPVDLSPGLAEALEGLGVGVGEPTPRLGFSIASWPDEWRTTSQGGPYARFQAVDDLSIVLDVRGYEAEVDDEATLFVHGPDGVALLPLPAGRKVAVEIERPPPGRYYCALLHQRTSISPAYIAFEVADAVATPPEATWTLSEADALLGSGSGDVLAAPGDLGKWESADVILAGPPGWEVQVLWREVSRDYLGKTALNATGVLDTSLLLALTRDRRHRRLLGDLELELGELGAVRLPHERVMSPKAMTKSLRELLASRQRMVERRTGDYAQLVPSWFQPVCECLGYELGELVEQENDSAPWHVAAAPLLTTERFPDGTFERNAASVLIMVEELHAEMPAEHLAWIDRVCGAHRAREALLSTGLKWAKHGRRSRLAMRVWDLVDVLDGEEEHLIAFLRDVAEGV